MSVRAARTGLVLTPAGTILLPVAIVGALLSWSLVPAAALASAAALSVLLLAPLGAWLCLRGLVVLPPPPRQAFAGEGFPSRSRSRTSPSCSPRATPSSGTVVAGGAATSRRRAASSTWRRARVGA
jgi:hypothetical protein